MIKTFCEKFGYPKEAEEQFSAVYEKVLADGAARSEIYDIMDTFFMGRGRVLYSKAQRTGAKAWCPRDGALHGLFYNERKGN